PRRAARRGHAGARRRRAARGARLRGRGGARGGGARPGAAAAPPPVGQDRGARPGGDGGGGGGRRAVSAPRVTAVVLAYGAEPWLAQAVRAVLDSAGVDVDVVLVDNGATGDAVDKLRDLPGVRVVEPGANTGYTGGCRLGAAAATGDFLAFVNSDAIVSPHALARLTAVAAEPGVGAAMGSIRLGEQPDLI